MGRREAGIDQFCGRNRLDDGFTSTAAKDEQDVPVLIRMMIRPCEFSGLVYPKHLVASDSLSAVSPMPLMCDGPGAYAFDLGQYARDLVR